MTFRWFPRRFGSKGCCIAKVWSRFTSKIPFDSNATTGFFKILNSVSFVFLWIGAKSKPFSRVFISAKVRTLCLKLKTVFEIKYPLKSLLLLISVMLSPETSVLRCNSSRIFTRTSSCDERKFRLNMFSEIFDVFIHKKLLVTLTGGDVCILEEFSFSSWWKIFFIFV